MRESASSRRPASVPLARNSPATRRVSPAAPRIAANLATAAPKTEQKAAAAGERPDEQALPRYTAAMTHLLVAMMTAAALAPGAKAPQFSLESTGGKKVSLSDFQGRTVVLAFYSKAFTGG
jgi:hypothetical protein